MPSIGGHFALASELERILQIHEDSFYYGSILPDIIAKEAPPRPPHSPKFRKNRYGRRVRAPQPAKVRQIYMPDPHYTVFDEQLRAAIPCPERFWRENSEISAYMKLGYGAHLMMDDSFIRTFCPQQILGFSAGDRSFSELLHRDYNRLNPVLVQEFQLDLDRINHLLHQEYFYIPVDGKRFASHVEWINNLNPQSDPRYIDPQSFIKFIRQTAQLIVADQNFHALVRELIR